MKIITSETQEPIINTPVLHPDHYERGLDPFHADAMPDEFKDRFPNGERQAGWLGIDWCGNAICWIPDGTEIEVPDA